MNHTTIQTPGSAPGAEERRIALLAIAAALCLFFATAYAPVRADDRTADDLRVYQCSEVLLASAGPPTAPRKQIRQREAPVASRMGADLVLASTTDGVAYRYLYAASASRDVEVDQPRKTGAEFTDSRPFFGDSAHQAVASESSAWIIARAADDGDGGRQPDDEVLGPLYPDGESELTIRSGSGERRTFDPRPLGEDLTLTAVHASSAMGDGTLAFGDIQGPGDGRYSAFLYYDDTGRYQIFSRVAPEAAVRDQYLNNFPCYVAALGDVGYILVLDEEPWVGRIRLGVDGVEELPLFPEEFHSRPRLEAPLGWAPPRRATAFRQTLEASTMAAGLYAWNDRLYLLAKEVSMEKQDGPLWWLVEVDPTDGQELSRLLLPTNAPNLSVEPGEIWTLKQSGPVEGIGAMHAPYARPLPDMSVACPVIASM